MIPCIQTVNLSELWNNFNKSILEKYENNEQVNDVYVSEKEMINYIDKIKNIYTADVILINEGQFFPDLYSVVKDMVENKKHVYVCGLDGDFERKKFGQILDLIPIADKIEKLSSLCSLCKNGTRGIFSMRLTKEKTQTLIGSDNYIPVCRNCYEDNIIL
jgi:thymidine kinase